MTLFFYLERVKNVVTIGCQGLVSVGTTNVIDTPPRGFVSNFGDFCDGWFFF